MRKPIIIKKENIYKLIT